MLFLPHLPPYRLTVKLVPILLLVTVFLRPHIAIGTVYYSKEEAFELAFGQGADIRPISLFLTEEQVKTVEKAAKIKLDSQLFTMFEGKKGGQTLGYAVIDSETVRTQPETVLIVLSPTGEIAHVEVLAFHEPPEYQPPTRWFATLYGKPLEDLHLNQGVDAISGATLSARSSLGSIRKAIAIYNIVLKEGGS